MVGRAALNITGTNQTYFFFDNKYVKINWTPGQNKDTIQYGPAEIAKEWHTLKEVGFGWVDAILPIPGHDHRAYFFCGNEYARIEYTPGTSQEKIIGGARSITSYWPSLKQAGFSHIDGAIVAPGTTDQAYIFSGDQYCRIRFTEGASDELISGPRNIASYWGAMKFSSIDTIIPEPGSERGAYAFSNGQYSHFNMVVGGTDEPLAGPRTIGSSWWSSLHQAGFY